MELKNLQNALMYSDNIYFAQVALRLGSSLFTQSLNKIGFNQEIEFPLHTAKSQFSNSEGIDTEGKLAD